MKFYSIPNANSWKRVEQIHKGWSKDEKYFIEDHNGEHFLLRISAAADYERKLAEFKMVQRFNQLDFPMSRAIDFGKCNDGEYTYMLLTWTEGIPLEEVLTSFSEERQYELGVEAGRYLKLMHSLPVDNRPKDWALKMKEKIVRRLDEYKKTGYKVEKDDLVIDFVTQNLEAVDLAELVYHHGDFHIGNQLYTPAGKIGVIDFNRWDIGDYAEEFYKVQQFDREVSTPFARGKIEGYFNGQPPGDFWERLAVYVAYIALFSIVWSLPFGEKSVRGMIVRTEMAMDDYDNFTRFIPKWYEV